MALLRVRYLDLQLEISRRQVDINLYTFGEKALWEIRLRILDMYLVLKAIRLNEERSEDKGKKTNG